jgi:hypothetical protein
LLLQLLLKTPAMASAAMLVPLVLVLCTAAASAAVVEHTFKVKIPAQKLVCVHVCSLRIYPALCTVLWLSRASLHLWLWCLFVLEWSVARVHGYVFLSSAYT